MINTTVSQILNEDGKERFTLYAEWLESHFKIMLFKSEMVPMCGEMNEDAVKYFSSELHIPYNDYLCAAKEALCGKDSSIKFFISDAQFEWKRENIWTCGKITLSPVPNVKALSETFRHSLDCHKHIQNRLIILERENGQLEEMKAKMIVQIEEMTRIKTTIEHDLYKKFLLVLNTKKKKIRELEDTIKTSNFVKREPAFDACTDESDESEAECDKKNADSTKPVEMGKRKSMDAINDENTCKVRRTNVHKNTDNVVDHRTSPQPSTSKEVLGCIKGAEKNHSVSNTESIHDTKQATSAATKESKSLINFLEEESEEELFSQ